LVLQAFWLFLRTLPWSLFCKTPGAPVIANFHPLYIYNTSSTEQWVFTVLLWNGRQENSTITNTTWYSRAFYRDNDTFYRDMTLVCHEGHTQCKSSYKLLLRIPRSSLFVFL
jgi:hypothetical protein